MRTRIQWGYPCPRWGGYAECLYPSLRFGRRSETGSGWLETGCDSLAEFSCVQHRPSSTEESFENLKKNVKKNERKIPPVCWSSHKKYIKVSRDTPYKFRRQELIIKQTSDPNEITKRIFSDASEVCGDLKMREVAYLDTGTRSWNGCHKILSFLQLIFLFKHTFLPSQMHLQKWVHIT